jgi:hypothetical protein
LTSAHTPAPRFIPSRAVEENDQAEFYPPRGKVRVSDFTRRIRESDEKKL